MAERFECIDLRHDEMRSDLASPFDAPAATELSSADTLRQLASSIATAFAEAAAEDGAMAARLGASRSSSTSPACPTSRPAGRLQRRWSLEIPEVDTLISVSIDLEAVSEARIATARPPTLRKPAREPRPTSGAVLAPSDHAAEKTTRRELGQRLANLRSRAPLISAR